MGKIHFILKIFVLINFFSLQLFSQWISRYNGPGNSFDEAFAVVADISGNVYVTGSSAGINSNLDYATVKYSASGQLQWAARYDGGNLIDIANAIAVDASGNVYVTGISAGSISLSDYATIKYNSSGQQVWVARYNGPVNGVDEAFSVAVDGSGNVYVTGQSLSITNYDYATIKYNSSGQQLWVARYNGPQNSIDNAVVVRVDASGNVYVTGSSTGSGSGLDYATVKYNSSGQMQWVARYNGTNNADDVPSSMEIDGGGNIYVTGGSSGSTSSNDYATVKYNYSGEMQWAARYNGTGNDNDVVFGLAVSASGDVYVTGSSIGQGSATDYATVKYNSSGQQQWAARYNGPNNTSDDASSIVADAGGNVYVTGASNSGGTNLDYLTLKYDQTGTQVWEQRYNGPGNGIDAAASICIDISGNIFVTGNSVGIGSSSDYATLRYSITTSIEPVSNEIPNEFRLYNNYPNPFNPVTKIKFDLPKQSAATITVYDVSGKVIKTLVGESLGAGSYSVDFDATGLATGVYLYRITAGDFSDVKKMVLVK
ncbi:MAG: SBBP repeat-containing protein [Chlorobi bacterium]|nr:SBBP repeat-containing protein [Chlorobiota bacterium]MCI0714743.1 SBBP repeat-containing protein [Chlorobiota bacterium]